MTTHRDLVRSLRRSRFARLLSCETGAVAVIVALLAPVLIGAMGLGAESGYWYLTQRKAQNAADVAVHAAAKKMVSGEDISAMQTVAEYLAEQAGIDLASATVVVNRPPVSGAYAGDNDAVEVIVTDTVARMFTAIYTNEPLAIDGRAVALAIPGGTGCVLALSPTADGAITVSGSSDSSLTLCDMISNSSGVGFQMSGSGSSVSANCVQTTGTAVTTANLTMNCERVRERASSVADPFAGVPEPALTGACQDGNVGSSGGTTTRNAIEPHASGMPSMLFCNGLNLRGTVTFGPGLYLIRNGDFVINSNANVLGDGVVFFLAPDVNIRFNGSATLDLSPPTTGSYTGMLIFGSRSATLASHQFSGNLTSTLEGAIYTPASHMTVSGSAQTPANSCTQFISNTVNFTGGGTININCENPFGPSIVVEDRVALVE